MIAKPLTALALAFVVSLAIAVIAWLPWRRSRPVGHRCWGGALALGLAFVSGFVVLEGWPDLPPREAWMWIAPIAVAATLIGLVDGLSRPQWWLQGVYGAMLALAIGWLFHPPQAVEHSTLWRIALSAIVFLMWINLEMLAHRRSGASLPLCLWIIFTGVSIVLLQYNIARFSLLATTVSASFAGLVIASWLNPRISISHGGTYLAAALLSTLLLIGWFYKPPDSAPLTSFRLLAMSPFALWLGELKVFDRMRPWQAVVVRAVFALAPVTVAVILT